jgi:sarcosine oxidase, subunit alpha
MKELIIIGAGPAGLSAGITAAENGVDVTIIDEFMKPGGRLLGQLHEEKKNHWWNGIEESQKLYEKVQKLRIPLELSTSVHNIEKDNDHWLVQTNKGEFKCSRLLVATGASECPIPIPGWTLPGVMTIGAAQVMTNVHQVKPGYRGIIIGANVLSLAIVRELILAGVEIQGILLPSDSLLNQKESVPTEVFKRLVKMCQLAPSLLIKLGGSLANRFSFINKLASSYYPSKGVKVWGVPIQIKHAVTEIVGEGVVEGVKTTKMKPNGEAIPGSEKFLSVDFVCLAGGLTPLAELVALTDCPFKYIPSLGGHVPIHNEKMETPVRGLYVAGNITGIESAKVAMAQGTLAGYAIAESLSKLSATKQTFIKKAVMDIKTIRENAMIQFHPEVTKGRETLLNIAKQYE